MYLVRLVQALLPNTLKKKKIIISKNLLIEFLLNFFYSIIIYFSEVKQKRVETIGGKYIPNMKLDDWSKTLDNNLVVINKEIALISNAIIKFNFPDINETTLNTVKIIFFFNLDEI